MNRQPVSPDSPHQHSRLRGATKSHTVCPYCAVGCSQNLYTKGGEVIDIEGDPESPTNEGTLCPKGANTFQLVSNPHRIERVMYRAPYSDHWVQRPLDWAMDHIAHLVTLRQAILTIVEGRSQIRKTQTGRDSNRAAPALLTGALPQAEP
jgi:anaerobic selenocysteine-containing dehydrogenase